MGIYFKFMRLTRICRRHPNVMNPAKNCKFCWDNYYLSKTTTKKHKPEEIFLHRIFGGKPLYTK